MGVDVPDQSVGSHLDRLPLDHDLLHAAGVVDLVPADAELARPGQHRLENFDLILDDRIVINFDLGFFHLFYLGWPPRKSGLFVSVELTPGTPMPGEIKQSPMGAAG